MNAGKKHARCVANAGKETTTWVDNAVQQLTRHVETLCKLGVENAERKS